MGGKIETEVEAANEPVVNNINVNIDDLNSELMQFAVAQLFLSLERSIKQYVTDIVVEVLNEQAEARADAFKEFADKIQQITVDTIREASRPGGVLYRSDPVTY